MLRPMKGASISIVPRPIDAESFAPFGQLIEPPADIGRVTDVAKLVCLHKDCEPRLGVAKIEANTFPIEIEEMERHPHSSQTFLPLDKGQFLVVAAPDHHDSPDLHNLEAFLADGVGINFDPGIWHYQMTVLGHPATFAVLLWSIDEKADTDYHSLREPVLIEVHS